MNKPFVIPECQNCLSKTLSVFNVLPLEEVVEMSASKGCNYYRKGQTIFFEGNRAHGIYCVHKGKIKLHKLGLDGKEQILRFAKDEPYQKFAQWSLLFLVFQKCHRYSFVLHSSAYLLI